MIQLTENERKQKISEFKNKIGIPQCHDLTILDSTWQGARHGQDLDIYICEELNEKEFKLLNIKSLTVLANISA